MGGRRVVITGLGVVSALGTAIDEFWANCIGGNTQVEYIPEHWKNHSSYHSRVWSPLPEIDYSVCDIRRVDKLRHDPISLLGIHATKQALLNAGIKLELKDSRQKNYQLQNLDGERTGVFIGTGVGGAYTFLTNHANHLLDLPLKHLEKCSPQGFSKKPINKQFSYPKQFNPFSVSMLMPNATGAALGIKFSVTGPNTTVTTACAAGTSAIGYAFKSIRDGGIDNAICGGCEYINDEHGAIFRGFDFANTLTLNNDSPTTANRPFDKNRTGFLYSQGGAAILILEEFNAAAQRNAPIIAEICAFAETFDAYSMMAIEPSGKAIGRMIKKLLFEADFTPASIDYINAHGTGTKSNDEIECGVIEREFGNNIFVNSSKSLLGHTIGASGAFEAVITALSLKHQTLHASLNLDDPIADLNFVRQSDKFPVRRAISQSFAFGGHNSALLFRHID